MQTLHKLETWSFERFRASESDIYLVEFVAAVRNLKQYSNSIQLEWFRSGLQDAYDTSVEASQRSSKLSNGNVKANELLYGTRCSLDDMIMAHLLSLVKIGCVDASSGRQVLGPLIVSAPSPMLPLLEGQMGAMSDKSGWSEETLPEARRMYAAFGWSFPESFGRKTGRILDSRPTWQCLNWKATWDFQRLVQDFQDDIHLDIIQEGIY